MLALRDQTYEPITASETEAAIAKTAATRLRAVAEANQNIVVHVEGAANVAVPLPAAAVRMMVQILSAMAERVPISVIPQEAELSTQQAADFLNVSRPYICKLLDAGKIPHRCVNRHRRVKFADLLLYERQSREDRAEALADMAREARDLDLE